MYDPEAEKEALQEKHSALTASAAKVAKEGEAAGEALTATC